MDASPKESLVPRAESQVIHTMRMCQLAPVHRQNIHHRKKFKRPFLPPSCGVIHSSVYVSLYFKMTVFSGSYVSCARD